MNLPPLRRSLIFALPALITCSSLLAQSTFNFNPNTSSNHWNSTDVNWWLEGDPTAWIDGAIAKFSTGNAQTLHLTSNISASAITQELLGSHMTFLASENETLTLTGSGLVVSASDESSLTFGENLHVGLSPSSQSITQYWMSEGVGNITVEGVLSGAAGSVTGNVASGGLVKTGSGSLTLNGANTYSGVTELREGTVIANHQTAFGSSKIRFTGGLLRYGSSAPTGGYASQFLAIETGESARLDTNSQNITLSHGLTGQGGLEKWGTGILTLSSGNTYSGETTVRQGILKAALGGGNSAPANNVSNPFGTNSLITILDGATLDINGNGTGGTNGGNAKSYEVTASGLGVAGYATIWNSGETLSNMGLLSKLTFNTDISLGGSKRMDIHNVLVQGGTNTLYKRGSAEVSWTSTNANNTVGNIVIEQGSFTIQSSQLGSTSHHIEVRSGTNLRTWASVTVNKQLLLLGGARVDLVASSPTASSDNESNVNFNNTTTLQGGSISFVTDSGFRVGHLNELIKGEGNLTLEGKNSASLLNAGTSRTSTYILKKETNSFTGDVLLKNSVVRMSDNTIALGNGGTLGNNQNKLTLESASTTNYTVLDLHGTNQTVGGLNSSGAGVSRIQNRRAGSDSTLTVGQGNADGTFAGILEDYSSTFNGKALSSDGSTGRLAFDKMGTGTQILTGVNTFTGGLTIRQGRLQIGTGATGISTAKAGNSGFTILSGGILGGNGTAGATNFSNSILSGGKLEVGTTNQTAAQTLSLSGALSSQGTLSFDIFNSTLGSGNNAHSDALSFLTNSVIDLEGTLEVVDRSNTSGTWTEGTWFRIFDWAQVNTESNRNVFFSNWLLPTLGANLAWDTSELTTLGRLSVTSVPEPSRMILGLVGLLGFVLKRRR